MNSNYPSWSRYHDALPAVLSAETWQNMPPPNMPLWQQNYFESKALIKTDTRRAL